jgi:hypothetical protein
MPYGPRFGRIEEPPTEQEQAAKRRRERKLTLVQEAVLEHELSWAIKTRHSLETWRILLYDLQWREGIPGALIVVDRDTDMDVKIYAPGMWFDVDTVMPLADDFVNWKPQKAYLEDLADRLMDEEETP